MKQKNLLIPSYAIMIITIFILPFFSAVNYSIISNTTSQLGAQLTRNAWIMNLNFILLGTSTIYCSLVFLGRFYFQKIIAILFGLSLIATSIYSHAPIDLSLSYSVIEDNYHSFFASTTGFSFVLLAISSAFILDSKKGKSIAFGMGIFATLMSILIFTFDATKGIWQRAMFITAFAWLIYFYESQDIK